MRPQSASLLRLLRAAAHSGRGVRRPAHLRRRPVAPAAIRRTHRPDARSSPPPSTTRAIPTASTTPSRRWSGPASSASSPGTRTRTTTTPSAPTPSSSSSPTARPTDADLASQPTLSRFENQIDIPSLFRLRDVFIDQFIASFAQPPITLTFDLDAVDDPTHGSQQLTLFHGFYEQYQYLPLVITCAENDAIVMLSLRHGTAIGFARCRRRPGVPGDADSRGLAERADSRAWRWRVRQPDHVRGERATGRDLHLRPLDQRGAAAGKRGIAGRSGATSGTRRTSRSGCSRGSGIEPERGRVPRWVVVKAEANAQGTNRRFVTTNRPGAQAYPEATYDEYAMRGESENRNKEFKCGMAMDRLSDHRFMANYFRLYLHAAALNLLVRLRREIADPPPAPAGDVPAAALPEPARKRYQNARRRQDPLGEGQPATWRLLLIKVAASVVVSCRRIVVRLSGSWPHQQFFERVAQHVCRRPAVAALLDRMKPRQREKRDGGRGRCAPSGRRGTSTARDTIMTTRNDCPTRAPE